MAALKQSLAQSKMRIKQFQWIETQVVSLKGEVKSTTQSTCYYGADGDPSDPVSLDVTEGALTDGTQYNAQITLAAPSQNLSVTVTKSGYRPMGQ